MFGSGLAPFDFEVPTLLEQMVEGEHGRRRQAGAVGHVFVTGPRHPALMFIELIDQLQGEKPSARR